jgi:hypothetical protein
VNFEGQVHVELSMNSGKSLGMGGLLNADSPDSVSVPQANQRIVTNHWLSQAFLFKD